MRGFLYARVSTRRQAERELSVSAQLRAMRGYLREQGHEIINEYVDEGRSGRSARRPAFAQMIEDVQVYDVGFICVWKLDRIARNMEISASFDAYCREHDVKILSLQEPIDDSPQGKLSARIFEGFAEFYSESLGQDIRRGKREAARQGYYPHGKAPLGYVKEPAGSPPNSHKKLVPDKETAHVVIRMFEEMASGRTGTQIATGLNTDGVRTSGGRRWRPQRIYDVIRNPVYCGDIVVGKMELGIDGKHRPGRDPVLIQDVHPPLVSRELFDQANEVLASRSGSYQQRSWDTSPYLLSGLCLCGLCGRHMVGESAKGGKHSYYTCQQYLREGKEACSGVRVSKRRLESFVVARVRDVILQEEHLLDLTRMVNEELSHQRESIKQAMASARQQVAGLESRLRKHYDALETGALEPRDVAPRLRELQQQLEVARRATARLETQSQEAHPLAIDAAMIREYVSRLRETLRHGTIRERRRILGGIIESVTVDAERVEIKYGLPQLQKAHTSKESPVLFAVRSIGGERIRTANLCVANAALSRLELRPPESKKATSSGAGTRTPNLSDMSRTL